MVQGLGEAGAGTVDAWIGRQSCAVGRIKRLASDPSQKIEAIKVYREETDASLVEAKEAVEAFINST